MPIHLPNSSINGSYPAMPYVFKNPIPSTSVAQAWHGSHVTLSYEIEALDAEVWVLSEINHEVNMKYSGQSCCTYTLIAITHPKWKRPNSDIRTGSRSSQWPWPHNLFEGSPASEIQLTRPGWARKDGQIIHNHYRSTMIQHACSPQATHPFTPSHSRLVINLCLGCQQQHLVKAQQDPAQMILQNPQPMCIYRST